MKAKAQVSTLQSVRRNLGISQESLAELAHTFQEHLSAIESGKHLPRQKTRKQLESLLGNEIDWEKTLAGDRDHVLYAVKEFIQVDEVGASDRISFLKQCLELLSETIND